MIAAVAEGRRWRFEGDADVKSKFWGRSIELRPEGEPCVLLLFVLDFWLLNRISNFLYGMRVQAWGVVACGACAHRCARAEL